jgi:hypothetical protein
VDSISSDDGNIIHGGPICDVVLDDFIPAVRIDLDSSNVGIWQTSNASIQIGDVLIGPLNLEAGVF